MPLEAALENNKAKQLENGHRGRDSNPGLLGESQTS